MLTSAAPEGGGRSRGVESLPSSPAAPLAGAVGVRVRLGVSGTEAAAAAALAAGEGKRPRARGSACPCQPGGGRRSRLAWRASPPFLLPLPLPPSCRAPAFDAEPCAGAGGQRLEEGKGGRTPLPCRVLHAPHPPRTCRSPRLMLPARLALRPPSMLLRLLLAAVLQSMTERIRSRGVVGGCWRLPTLPRLQHRWKRGWGGRHLHAAAAAAAAAAASTGAASSRRWQEKAAGPAHPEACPSCTRILSACPSPSPPLPLPPTWDVLPAGGFRWGAEQRSDLERSRGGCQQPRGLRSVKGKGGGGALLAFGEDAMSSKQREGRGFIRSWLLRLPLLVPIPAVPAATAAPAATGAAPASAAAHMCGSCRAHGCRVRGQVSSRRGGRGSSCLQPLAPRLLWWERQRRRRRRRWAATGPCPRVEAKVVAAAGRVGGEERPAAAAAVVCDWSRGGAGVSWKCRPQGTGGPKGHSSSPGGERNSYASG